MLSQLAKFMSKLAIIYREAAKQMLYYLIKIKNIDLIYEAKPLNMNLINYINLNFAVDADNRRFMSGFLFKLNDVCIHW